MSYFLKFVLSLIFVLGLLVVVIFHTADGRSDEFYLRLASPAQSSLILGTSKAAQGVHPKVLKNILGKNIYNYSFTIAHSAYGPAYLRSITNKLDSSSTDGIFIITVDPWSISEDKKFLDQHEGFSEDDKFINLECVTCYPNYSYLIKYYQKSYYHLLLVNQSSHLHDDGWLEIKVPMDSTVRAVRRKVSVKKYSSSFGKEYKLSPIRLEYLGKTIKFLQNYGRVYLVRLPVHQEIFKIEDDFIQNFNKVIADNFPLIKYLDFSPERYKFKYVDGIHLDVKSGDIVSTEIAEWVKNDLLVR